MPNERLAFDKASVRTITQDGHMHVSISNISKANVCPYRGAEIPFSEQLGLKPDQVYQLLRAPEEMARAVATFNNLPITIKHTPMTALDHQADVVVGSTGTDAAFHDPYLTNSLVIWDGEAIAGIESDEQRELSCGYHYKPDMTPGVFGGVKYDGVMRDIRGNHVALVEDGRAGDDVVVGDSAFIPDTYGVEVPDVPTKPGMQAMDSQENNMQTRTVTLSPRAAVAKGALAEYLLSHMAADSQFKPADVHKIVGRIVAGTGAKNWKERKAGIAAQIVTQAKAKMAMDADLDQVVQLLNKLDDGGVGPAPEEAEVGIDDVLPMVGKEAAPPIPGRDDGTADVEAQVRELLQGKVDDQVMAAVIALLKPEAPPAEQMPPNGDQEIPGQPKAGVTPGIGKDTEMAPTPKSVSGKGGVGGAGVEGNDKDPPGVTPQAMDEAIKLAVNKTQKETIARMNAVREAEKLVRPYIGELTMAMDSAEDIYRLALTTSGIDVTGVHPSAFPAMLAMLPKPGSEQPRPRMGMDSKGAKDFATRYPNAGRIRNLG